MKRLVGFVEDQMADQKKQVYTDFALGGNVHALGGNLWNNFVSKAVREKAADKSELNVAAAAFFDEILPELDNFVQQKIDFEKRESDLQNGRYRKALQEISEFQGSAPQAARIAREALVHKQVCSHPKEVGGLPASCPECAEKRICAKCKVSGHDYCAEGGCECHCRAKPSEQPD